MQDVDDTGDYYGYTDKQGYDDLRIQRAKFHVDALESPLTPGFEFDLLEVYHIPPPLNGRRPNPLMTGETHVRCHLVAELAVSPERANKVWTARIVPGPSDSRRASIVSTEHLIVVKFLQPSFYELPEVGEDKRDLWNHTPYEWQARREARFYKEAESLQGTVVPYFYAWQKIIAPWSEEIWVLAMEYIPGPTFLELAETTHPHSNNIANLYRSAIDGLLLIHQKGIAHGDLYPRNMIVASSDSADPYIVIIDPRPDWPWPDLKNEQLWLELDKFYWALAKQVPCCCEGYQHDSFYNSVPNKPKLPRLPGTLISTGRYD